MLFKRLLKIQFEKIRILSADDVDSHLNKPENVHNDVGDPHQKESHGEH